MQYLREMETIELATRLPPWLLAGTTRPNTTPPPWLLARITRRNTTPRPRPSPQVTSHAPTARGRSTWTRIYREREERKRTQLIFLRLGMTGWTIQMQYIMDRWCGEYPIALEINCRACKGNYVTLNYGGVAQFTESKANQFHIFLQSFSHVFLQSDFLSPLTIGINSILIRECKPRGLWKKKLHHMHMQ
jgi:hypothetical protein